jgi:hypothetical protein
MNLPLFRLEKTFSLLETELFRLEKRLFLVEKWLLLMVLVRNPQFLAKSGPICWPEASATAFSLN